MDERDRRAIAVACATIIVGRNKMPEMEEFLGIADEFVQYIEGDDSVILPRPDHLSKGKI